MIFSDAWNFETWYPDREIWDPIYYVTCIDFMALLIATTLSLNGAIHIDNMGSMGEIIELASQCPQCREN